MPIAFGLRFDIVLRTVHWRLAARTQQGAPCSYKNYSVVKCTCFDAVAV